MFKGFIEAVPLLLITTGEDHHPLKLCIDFNSLSSNSQLNQTTPPSSGTEYWSPGQSIPMMTPPNFQQIGQFNQVDYQPVSMTPHSYNNLHCTPHIQRAISTPTPTASTPRLTEILESQKRLETSEVSVLERLECLKIIKHQLQMAHRSHCISIIWKR